MRELVAITNRNKIIFQLIMSAVLFVMLAVSVLLILTYSEYPYLGVVLPFVILIVYCLLDIVQISLLPEDRILRVYRKLVIRNRRRREYVIDIREIISVDGRERLFGYGHLYLVTERTAFTIKYLKDLELVSNKILSLMIECKNPYIKFGENDYFLLY